MHRNLGLIEEITYMQDYFVDFLALCIFRGFQGTIGALSVSAASTEAEFTDYL